MSATLIDGKSLAATVRTEQKNAIASLAARGVQPGLAAILAGNDPASRVYVRNKARACGDSGVRSEVHEFPEQVSEPALVECVARLNADPRVHGIVVQLPLLRHLDAARVLAAVSPAKDVDGFHPVNVGRLALGRPSFVPCTPAGIIELLRRNEIPIKGASACVVGRSQIVGRPMAQLLIQHDATVTVCHSRTQDLKSVTRQADILVVAVGRAGFIGRDHIKPGATLIDVGMNKVTDEAAVRELFGDESERRLQIMNKRGYTLVGDVHPAEADEVAGRRTPVPGGVGLLTVAMLMRNTVKATRQRRG